jgi:large subunit ribosomal protein L15
MKLHDLKPRYGSTKRRKRVGRGIAAGQGKTAGRGMKGQGARSGSGGKLYHQGGNLPFFRRLPFKRGFTNFRRVTWNEINLRELAGFKKGSELDPETLDQVGLVSDKRNPIVLLGDGEVDVELKIKVHRASRSAVKKIEAAGGSVEIVEW